MRNTYTLKKSVVSDMLYIFTFLITDQTSPSKSKSTPQCSESGDGDSKVSPPGHNGNKEHLSSIVREISQARLISLRKRRSGQSVVLDNGDAGTI